MEWYTLIREVVLVLIAAIVTYLSTRKKYKADVEKTQHEIKDVIFSTYKTELEAMNNRIGGYVQKIDDLEKKVKFWEEESKRLRDIVDCFEKKYIQQPRTRKTKTEK